MSRDDEVKNVRLFDARLIDRNIRKGLITRKDYDKHLKSLPDVTDKIAPRDAPAASGLSPVARPMEHVPAPIIIHPADPADSLDLGADDEDDEDEDEDEDEDDIEELDADDVEDESNGAVTEPPKDASTDPAKDAAKDTTKT